MKVDRITRKQIRDMKVGDVCTFTLPNYQAVLTGISVICLIKKLDGRDFVKVKNECEEPNTITYKRTK